MDGIDLKLLNILQSDARTSNAELARQVGLAPSAVLERVRKLEERQIIRGYEARINPNDLELGLLAFVYVRTDERLGSPIAERLLAELPEIQEIHHIAGEDCFLVKVRVANTDALQVLLRERIGAIPTIRSTRTTIVLATVKETATLPVPEP
jgi:Lrp/AsnC family transcriptional regulator, leucine-responsive regulatory protein